MAIDIPEGIQLANDEFLADVMAYLNSAILWGHVIIRKPFRANTWLRTSAYPETTAFFNAKLLSLDVRQENLKPISYARTLLHTDLINIFHPTPPSDDPLDYDPAEPNIRMEEITIETGIFRIKGKIRFGISQDLYKYFRNTSERFTSIYDADIYSPSIPKIGVMRVPFVLVRKDQSLYMQK